MCIGGSPSVSVPTPIKYAQVKTPTEGARTSGSDAAATRRLAAASQTNYTSARGLQNNAALQYKTLLGQ